MSVLATGVSYDVKSKAYKARIRVDGKDQMIGLFSEAIDAARAYDSEARKLYGEDAVVNFDENGTFQPDAKTRPQRRQYLLSSPVPLPLPAPTPTPTISSKKRFVFWQRCAFG
jgi:hypothetical protein